MDIANQILNIRKEQKLTQEEFGRLFYVTRQTVSNWEKGRSYPDLQILVDISNRFEISLDLLLKGDSEMVKAIDRERAVGTIKHEKSIIDFFTGAGTGIVFSCLFSPTSAIRTVAIMVGLVMIGIGWYKKEKNDRTVVEKQNIADMFSTVGKNDLKTFKHYIEDNKDEVSKMVSLTRYSYAVSPMIYNRNKENKLTQLNPSDFMSSIMGSSSTMMTSMSASVFTELIDNKEMIEQQYKVVKGKFPENYDEVMLILPSENTVSDMLLYAIGIRDLSELEDMIGKIVKGEKVENKTEPLEFSYDELMAHELKLFDPSSIYKYNEKYEIYENMTEDKEFMNNVYDNSLTLKIVGIVCPKGESTDMMSGVGYTKKLTEHVIKTAEKSEIVKKQLLNKDVNVFSNKRFDDETKDTGLDFQDLVSIDEEVLKSAFGTPINEKDIKNMTEGYMKEISSAITTNTVKAESAFKSTLSTLTKNLLNDYIAEKAVAGVAVIKLSDVDNVITNHMNKQSTISMLASLETQYGIPQANLKQMYTELIKGAIQQYIAMSSMAGNVTQAPNNSMLPNTQNKNTEVEAENNIINNENKVTDGKNNIINNENKVTEDKNNITNSENKIIDDKNNENNSKENTTVENENNLINNKTVQSVPMDTSIQNQTAVPTQTPNGEASAMLVSDAVDGIVSSFVNQEMVTNAAKTIGATMTEVSMQKTILTKVGELTGKLMETMASAFKVDTSKFAEAFKFEMTEEEMRRIFETMTSTTVENADTNLLALGYQDLESPTSISFYFTNFDSKELFIDFIDKYNDMMEKDDEEKVLKYTDLTGILMSSVKVIVDSVSYVLIAFVSISLIVSSIMIGIITYISVLERTKEIGVLRAIGASKKNISSIFNAETFIVGFFSGVIGIGTTLLLLIPTNHIIHTVTNNLDITAVLPWVGGIVLVVLSVILTLIGGLIPSKHAAKKDPVLALRSE